MTPAAALTLAGDAAVPDKPSTAHVPAVQDGFDSMRATCQSCIFRQPDERPEYSVSGWCHRRPPTLVFVTYDGVNGNVEQYYPWVTPDDWCGEFIQGKSADNEAIVNV